MEVKIYPGRTNGVLHVPGSKSYGQRAILAAAVADGSSEIHNLTYSDDVKTALAIARDLGCRVVTDETGVRIEPGITPAAGQFYAGESGLSARMLAMLLMAREDTAILDGAGSLKARPFDGIVEIARQLGVRADLTNGSLPVRIRGPMRDADLSIDGSATSQFVSGLLTALPLIGYSKKLVVRAASSKPYIDMTVSLLELFGVHWRQGEGFEFRLAPGDRLIGTTVEIESDWSSAAAVLAVGVHGGKLVLTGLQMDSLQPDKQILQIFDSMISRTTDGMELNYRQAEGFTFDATDCPDLFPPLAAIAVSLSTPSVISGLHRLKGKESDRGETIRSEFAKLGIRTEHSNNQMIIYPGTPEGGRVNSHHDHRIAMALSALALSARSPVIIEGVECVSKSYPGFFDDLQSIGAEVELMRG